MTDQHFALSIALPRADESDLRAYLPPETVRSKEGERLSEGRLGEVVTATVLIALSMPAITALCAWIATKGKNVQVKVSLDALGIKAKYEIGISQTSTPEMVRREIEAQGVKVAET